MPQNILRQIKESKQGLLNKAFLSLLAHRHFQNWYREFGESSFDSFCYVCFRGLEEIEESACMMRGELIAGPIEEGYEYLPPEERSQLFEKMKVIMQKMVEVDYEPPLFDDRNSFILHLHLMWHLYKIGISWPPSIKDMCLDLSFAKLLSAAHRRIAADLTRAEREETRTRKSTKTKRDGEVKKDQRVRIKEIFNKLTILPKSSLHAVAMKIKENEELHTDTIKKIMRSDPEIMKFFKPKGRFLVYENITTSYEDKEM